MMVNGVCKLADFGSAQVMSDVLVPQSFRTVYAYSPGYLAPEVMESNSFTSKVDIWSVGCIMLELLTGSDMFYDGTAPPPTFRLGKMPWTERKFKSSFEAFYWIRHNPTAIPKLPANLSTTGNDFLRSCFTREETKRPTAMELLKHSFLTQVFCSSHICFIPSFFFGSLPSGLICPA